MTLSLLAAALVAAGLFATVVAFELRDRRRLRDLRAVLEADLDAPGAPSDDDLRQALARTGRIAERALGGTGLLARVRATLARSDWTLTAGEFVAVSLATGGGGLLAGVLVGSPFLTLLLGPAGLLLPWALVRRSTSRRSARFEDQLPDILELLAASLESGAGLAQALELVVAEAPEPAASEFARVLTATRLGHTLVEGLQEMADRLDSRDLVYTVQAIAVQQRTGGRLADVLRVVASFMRGRAELRREVRALTAEGRLSAYILGGLPFGLAAMLSVTDPEYLTPLVTTSTGLLMLAVSGGLMLVAFFLMSRIIKVEV